LPPTSGKNRTRRSVADAKRLTTVVCFAWLLRALSESKARANGGNLRPLPDRTSPSLVCTVLGNTIIPTRRDGRFSVPSHGALSHISACHHVVGLPTVEVVWGHSSFRLLGLSRPITVRRRFFQRRIETVGFRRVTVCVPPHQREYFPRRAPAATNAKRDSQRTGGIPVLLPPASRSGEVS